MNIKECTKKERSVADIIVQISAEEFNEAINTAYRKSRNRISVPGFRKGKASRNIIERIYGVKVFHSDAFEAMMPDIMDLVVKDSGLSIIDMPDATNLDIKEDGSVEVTMEASLTPEVELGEYKGLKAYKPPVEVSQEEIDKEIDAIRNRNARIETTDRSASIGDIAVIDYVGRIDGETFEGGSAESYELELGSGAFIPGFEDKLCGMSAGENRDIELVFPENYAEDLAGKPVVFNVTMNEVREKLLPELDDEFAMDVSEFDTMDEYRESIREKQLSSKKAGADAEFERALMDKLASITKAEIPKVMVEQQMDEAMQNFAHRVTMMGMDPSQYLQMMNTTPAKYREMSRISSEKQVRIMLALMHIAKLENIEPTPEEIENEYNEASEKNGVDLQKLKEAVDEERIANDIKLRKASQIVIDNAVEGTDEEAGEEPGITVSGATDDGKEAPPVKKTKKPSLKAKAADKAQSAEQGECV